MATYSFADVSASIVGPGGAFSLGSGAGVAEEGISTAMAGEKDVMTIGADGVPMHSLKMDRSGKVTLRLLKTSNVNAQLQALYDAQSMSASLWGQNTITVSNTASGDLVTCQSVAFAKSPDKTFATEAGLYEWEFNAGYIDAVLGTY